MLFNSYIFILAFLPVTLAGFALVSTLGNRRASIAWLLLASMVFYAWWSMAYLALLFASCLVNAALVALMLRQPPASAPRRALLTLGIVFNLGTLGYFKYTNFLLSSLNAVAETHFPVAAIILPLGISFFVFQKIALLVDTYRAEVKSFDLLDFMLFVFFFPQLIAGPIVHHKEFMPQIRAAGFGRWLGGDVAIGLTIFTIGLFKKTVMADTIAQWADPAFAAAASGQGVSFAGAWIGALAYSFQLYFDFSGYSDMAVGLARLFGIVLPVNFLSPYKSRSIIEFWRRWHISLSSFLRLYLYIPLGGGRRGEMRRYANLLIVMLLGGLWHGAGWTFVLWGGLHGLLLMLNHAWRSWRERMGWRWFERSPAWSLFSLGLTFFCVVNAWVFFRAPDAGTALRMLGAMYGLQGDIKLSLIDVYRQLSLLTLGWGEVIANFFGNELYPVQRFFMLVQVDAFLQNIGGPGGVVVLLALYMIVVLLLPNSYELLARHRPGLTEQPLRQEDGAAFWRPSLGWAFLLAAMFVLSLLQLTSYSPFLYFQF